MKIASFLSKYCLDKGYITPEELPWLQYILEKRLSTIIIFIPLFAIGCYLTSPLSSFLFLMSFLFLRKRTNGYHASTVVGCFCASMLSVLLFLGLIIRVLSPWISIFLLIISSIVIIYLSPFEHPLMHWTPEEKAACAASSKGRLLILVVLVISTYAAGQIEIGNSILLGITMTAITLVLAQITKRRKRHEKTENNC